LTNTIVAGNTAAGVTNNISGSFAGANNLTNGDPHLSPLGNYGGPTQTMPPLAGSPAIDVGAIRSPISWPPTSAASATGRRARGLGAAEYIASPIVTTTATLPTDRSAMPSPSRPTGTAITFAPALSGQTNILTSASSQSPVR